MPYPEKSPYLRRASVFFVLVPKKPFSGFQGIKLGFARFARGEATESRNFNTPRSVPSNKFNKLVENDTDRFSDTSPRP